MAIKIFERRTIIGRVTRSLSGKGELSLPPVLIEIFNNSPLIGKFSEGCLFIATQKGPWRHLKITHRGGIIIPPELRKFAGLGEKVVIAGCGNRIEIWDPQRWVLEEARFKKLLEEEL